MNPPLPNRERRCPDGIQREPLPSTGAPMQKDLFRVPGKKALREVPADSRLTGIT